MIRTKLNLSQAAFAGLMGVSLRTIQDWEQGRRKPSGPAEALLRIAEQMPEVFTYIFLAVTDVSVYSFAA